MSQHDDARFAGSRIGAIEPAPVVAAGRILAPLRFASWMCFVILAVLSLLPENDMPRTGWPDPVNHFVAYAGSGAIASAAYWLDRRGRWVIPGLCVYAGLLEYLQRFSPGRHPGLDDFVASAAGVLCGGVLALAIWPRLWRRMCR